MWGKNTVTTDNTINLCNLFLVTHLIKKIKISQARGGGSQYSNTYKNAIKSIKRYPMPIICRAQLQSLQGIGDNLSQDLSKLIYTHYSAFLNKNSDNKIVIEKDNDLQKLQALSQISQSGQSSINECQSDVGDTLSMKSLILKYKPRINTCNSYFLQLLNRQTNPVQKQVEKQQICQQVRQKYPNTKNSQWKSMQSILQSNGYIIIRKAINQRAKQQVYYFLTQKGEIYVESLKCKSKNNQIKSKMIKEVRSFKHQVDQISNNTSHHANQNQPVLEKIRLIPLIATQDKPFDLSLLQLVIDCREKKQKAQSNYFQEKLIKKYGIKCKTAGLTLGDFIWIYDNKVLDYIIQRKKADDLASSIIDGRYKDQKYRLKNCGITNIFYIYQGHPSQNCSISQKQLSNALLKTRVKQHFKVYQTRDVNQTMKCLSQLHQQISTKILKGNAKYLCTLQQFIEQNSIHRNATVQKVFAMGLMSIPGVGKNAINKIIYYYKSYRSMHDHLKVKFNNNQDRIQFLKELLKGTGIITTLPKTLVGLLFNQTYSLKQDQQERSNFLSKQPRFSVINQQKQWNQDQYNP